MRLAPSMVLRLANFGGGVVPFHRTTMLIPREEADQLEVKVAPGTGHGDIETKQRVRAALAAILQELGVLVERIDCDAHPNPSLGAVASGTSGTISLRRIAIVM